MKLKDQVCSLESANKLKELGIEQKSLFYWKNYIVNGWALDEGDNLPYQGEIIAAFTASELLEIIPHSVDTGKEIPFNNFIFDMSIFHSVNTDLLLEIRQYCINYHCYTYMLDVVYCGPRRLFSNNFHDPSLAECCSKVLIKLFEDGYVKI